MLFTSATLAMGGQIGPFQQRVGAHDARAIIVASPFDYERHLRVYVAADMPLPSPTDARLALDALIDYLEFCTLRVRGGSLVLFTSYHDLRRAPRRWSPFTRSSAGPSISRAATSPARN